MDANSAPWDALSARPLRDDRRPATLGEKLIERETEAALATISPMVAFE